MSIDSTDNANKQNGGGEPTADSALGREAYVFGGALKDSVTAAAHDPWSLAKVGMGAALGLGITLVESRVPPLAVALEALGVTAALNALPGFIRDGKTAADVWSRTWNGTGNLNADRSAMRGIGDGIVDFGLMGAPAMVSPAVRAFQLAPRAQAASFIPWYSRPGIPPTLDMTAGFADGVINVGQVTTEVSKGGTNFLGQNAGFALAGEDGLFLTAAHSLADAKKTIIEFPFGRNYAVDLLGLDKEKDLALLRLVNPDATFKLPGLKLSESELRPGQQAMAVGFPIGRGLSASMTSLKRDDALAEAPLVFNGKTKMGFSGGPYLTDNGEVGAMQLQVKPYWFDIFPGNLERARRGKTEVSYAASSKQMREFVEANKNNPGVRMPTFEE
jgi:S1-C subfamily serine protease